MKPNLGRCAENAIRSHADQLQLVPAKVAAGTYPEMINGDRQVKEIINTKYHPVVSDTKSMDSQLKLTNGGRQSSACLRRTENPPWVLVSDAVSVLQNE